MVEYFRNGKHEVQEIGVGNYQTLADLATYDMGVKIRHIGDGLEQLALFQCGPNEIIPSEIKWFGED